MILIAYDQYITTDTKVKEYLSVNLLGEHIFASVGRMTFYRGRPTSSCTTFYHFSRTLENNYVTTVISVTKVCQTHGIPPPSGGELNRISFLKS